MCRLEEFLRTSIVYLLTPFGIFGVAYSFYYLVREFVFLLRRTKRSPDKGGEYGKIKKTKGNENGTCT